MKDIHMAVKAAKDNPHSVRGLKFYVKHEGAQSVGTSSARNSNAQVSGIINVFLCLHLFCHIGHKTIYGPGFLLMVLLLDHQNILLIREGLQLSSGYITWVAVDFTNA